MKKVIGLFNAGISEDHGQHVDRIGTKPTIAVHQSVGQRHENSQRRQTEIRTQEKLRALFLLGRRRLRLQEQPTGKRHAVVADAHQVRDLAPDLRTE
jgi:hypothetical protein